MATDDLDHDHDQDHDHEHDHDHVDDGQYFVLVDIVVVLVDSRQS